MRRSSLVFLMVLVLIQTDSAVARQHANTTVGRNVLPISTDRSPVSLPSVPERGSQEQWPPRDIDTAVPPVDPAAQCSLPEVLSRTGDKVESLMRDLNRFTATEVVAHQKVDRSGRIGRPLTVKFKYTVSVTPTPTGYVQFAEYRKRTGRSDEEFLDGISTVGTPSMVLVFHPQYMTDFSMKCEGLSEWRGRPAWQIRFEQRSDRPSHISAMVVRGHLYGLSLRGRAWIFADTYDVAFMETDLLRQVSKIGLRVMHERTEYAPVHFSQHSTDLFLPASTDLYADFHGRRFYRKHTFSEFKLFSVDVHEDFATLITDPR